MRSLIFGATGQIGALLVSACEERDDAVLGTWYRFPSPNATPIDLRDDIGVRELLADFRPDVVYVAAGMNQIDYAETQPNECEDLNAQSVARLAEFMAESSAKLVLLSSAHALGECPSPRREDAERQPVNVYGTTHMRAEDAVRAALPDRHLIVRTSCVFGPEIRGRNPAMHAVRRLTHGGRMKAATDRFVQPTYGPDLAAAIVELVKHDAVGTYHIVGPERMSEHAFATMTAFIFGYDADQVQSVPTAKLGEDAPRPKSLWLDRAKLRAELGANAIRSAGDGLRDLRNLLHKQSGISRAA
jgi:dTDP-4-dehydrorhamnose reductase